MKGFKAYYQFHRHPFVLLVLCFGMGIFLSGKWAYSDVLALFCILLSLVFLILVYLGRIRGTFFFVALLPVLTLLGMELFHDRSGTKENERLATQYRKNDALLVDVEEWRSGKGDWSRIIFRTKAIVRKDTTISLNVRILGFVKTKEQFFEGDRLILGDELLPIKNKNNPGEFDAESFWKSKGISFLTFADQDAYKIVDRSEQSWFQSVLDQLRIYLSETLDNNFDPKNAAVLKAIILGDKSELDHETRATFGNAGAMHVLAVSGLHVGILMLILMGIFQRFARFIQRQTALFIIVCILWIYALITGFSPSVVRAVFMFSMLTFAQMSSRNYDSLNILFFSAFVTLIISPTQLFDIGFQLSYLAMLGIILFYERIEALFQFSNWLLRKAWQGTAVGLSAQLMTIPFTLAYFHQFPNYFALSNLGLMVFAGLVLGFGLALFAFRFVPVLNKILALLLGFTLFLMLGFLEWIESLPGAVAYGYDLFFWQGAFLFLFVSILFFGRRTFVKIAGFAGLLGILISLVNDRFERMNMDEVLIFNSSRVVLTVKNGSRIDCFHDADEDHFSKVQSMVQDYTKLYPGKVFYHSIEENDFSIDSDKLLGEIKGGGSYYSIQINNRMIYFVTRNGCTDLPDNGEVICMPWVKGYDAYSIDKGAYRISLN